MNFTGIVIGASVFLMIGFFHPIVIKAEYWFGAFAFSCFWSILELFQQKKRVERGWFPANPKRKKVQ